LCYNSSMAAQRTVPQSHGLHERWYEMSVDEALEAQKSVPSGLSFDEVTKRQGRHGLNELEERRRTTPLQNILKQFKSPLIYMLFIAAGITFALKEYIDMTVILVVVIGNTIIGYLHESRADRAFQKLQQALTRTAFVWRDGSAHEIDARDIVPGDIIMLRAGSKVPADARLIEAQNLQIDESMLTGEWVPAMKDIHSIHKDHGVIGKAGSLALGDQHSMVFMNTIVQRGEGRAVVVAIGEHTQVGKIADLIQHNHNTDEYTPFQKKLAYLGKVIGVLVAIVTLVIFGLGVTLGREASEMFLTAVAIAVSVIPEGLPVAMTVVLAIATRRILAQRGLVKNLVAAETLGSASVILTDKTGTLTEGRMIVSEVVGCDHALNKAEEKKLFEMAVLAGDSIVEDGDDPSKEARFKGSATDRAVAMAAYERGVDEIGLEKAHRQKARLNFDNRRKFLGAVHRFTQAHDLLAIAGAPEMIYERCTHYELHGESHPWSKTKQKELEGRYEQLASQGMRVIAIAYGTKAETKQWGSMSDQELESHAKGLTMLGLIALRDPIRHTTRQMLQEAIHAGIRPVVVTGDHKLTARAIAKELGFDVHGSAVMEGFELDALSDEELKDRVQHVSIFSRVNPEHKLRIVDAWQARGATVAMTGDGINDAPALKEADIGVAVGSGTDIAKESADLILLDDKFSTIVAAIREGRVGFDNIRKIIVYLLSDSFTLFILVLGSLFLGLPLAILPVQVLWINLIQDSFPTFALGFEPAEDDIMRRKPIPRSHRILNREMKTRIFVIGIIADLLLLTVFYMLLKNGTDPRIARTVVFAGLSVQFFINLYAIKSFRKPVWRINPFSNTYLALSLVFGLIMMLAAVYAPFFNVFLHTTPLPGYMWLILLALGGLNLVGVETVKAIYRNKPQ